MGRKYTGIKLLMAALVAALAVMVGASTASAYLAHRCGGAATTTSTLLSHWGQWGIKDDMARTYGLRPVDSTLDTYVRQNFSVFTLAQTTQFADNGCNPGVVVPVGPTTIAGGKQIFGDHSGLNAKYGPGGWSSSYKPGWTRITVVVPARAMTTCTNPITGPALVWVWIPPLTGKTAPPATCTKRAASNYGKPLPCKFAKKPQSWTIFAAKIAWRWDTATSKWVQVKGLPVTIRWFVGNKPVKSWVIKSGGQWYKLTGKGKIPAKLCEVTKKTDLYRPSSGVACVTVKWVAKDKAREVLFVNQTTKPTSTPTTPSSPPSSPPPSSPPPPKTVPKTPPNNPGGGGPGDPNQGNPQPPGAGDTGSGGSSAPPPGPPSACQDPNDTSDCQPPPS